MSSQDETAPHAPLEASPAGAAQPSKTLEGESDVFSNAPPLEIQISHAIVEPPPSDAAASRSKFAMLDIWTRNRRYAVDVERRCIEVIDLATGHALAEHGLLGARLLGGQRVENGATLMTQPFPRPGTEAVFAEDRAGGGVLFSRTSTVTRVVLRLRQLTVVEPSRLGDTWDQALYDSQWRPGPG
ncbi:MAG: hypothetical protein U0271_35915 [Polyangiaceae bacterium]